MNDLPSPSQILEELADKVAAQIQRLAPVSFEAALGELISYHRFLLSANASTGPDGVPFNYAEVAGMEWNAPHHQWNRQYRRLYENAVDQLMTDQSFFRSLTHVPSRLLPHRGEPALSAAVLRSILDIGPMYAHRLEAWVTRHAVSEEGHKRRPSLQGLQRKVYSDVVTDVVGTWESLLDHAPTLFDWRDREAKSDHEQWERLRASWPYLWQHLTNTAYLLAVAVWNDDEIGSKFYRDALVRWGMHLGEEGHSAYHLARPRLLFPDVFSHKWNDALLSIEPLVHPRMPPPTPSGLFKLAKRNAHNDTVLITSALVAYWSMGKKQGSELAANTSWALLNRQASEPDDEDDMPGVGKTSFRHILLDLMRLEQAGRRFEKDTYGAQLDGLVSSLDNMTERRVVAGRVFTPSTLHGRHGLLTAFVAFLLALVPASGDDGLGDQIVGISQSPDVLPEGDLSLRNAVHELQRIVGALSPPAESVQQAARFFNDQFDNSKSVAALDQILNTSINAIEAARSARLEAAPIDESKVERIRSRAQSKILAPREQIRLFRDFKIEKAAADHTVKPFVARFTGVDKAQFVEPPMDDPSASYDEIVVSRIENAAGAHLWGLFCQKGKEGFAIDHKIEDEAFWNGIRSVAAKVGPEPILLVSRRAEGRSLRRFVYAERGDVPPPMSISTTGFGSGLPSYLATVEGIHVCGADFPEGTAWLFSSKHLSTIRYHALDEAEHYVSVAYEPVAKTKGEIVAKFSQTAVWKEFPIFELQVTDPEDV
ncbi:hypothetical protein [Mesorhizobium marinum]|uniref:Uncharacterized protein n=1 Tax=Mesorhizobium marinum TaxID=3228790 RepID=A0ABV3QZE9_9HYPH